MTADMKAVIEIAERNKCVNTTFGTLAAAFLELQAELETERDIWLGLDRKALEEMETAYVERIKRLWGMISANELAATTAEQQAAELQARLSRVEAETIERCAAKVKELEHCRGSYIVEEVLALSAQNAAAGQTESATVEDKR